MLAQWLQVVWLLSTGLAAGGYVMVAFALVPTVRRLPATTAWAFHRTFDQQVDRYMPITVAIGVISGAAVWLTRPQPSVMERVLIGVAILGMATVAVVSLTFNMRINRRLGQWTEQHVVENEDAFWDLRANWTQGNLIRTAGAVSAFLIAVAISVFWGAA